MLYDANTGTSVTFKCRHYQSADEMKITAFLLISACSSGDGPFKYNEPGADNVYH